MELDDLLRKEGLDAAGLEDALAWARRRAAELVRDVDRDPELGPLLDGATLVAADVEGARGLDPVVVHAPAERSWPEAPREPEREPDPVVAEASPVVAAPDEQPAIEVDRAVAAQDERSPAAVEEPDAMPAPEQDAVTLRAGSGPLGASARAETSQPRPLFADLRGLQAAFLAESDEEDDELPEVGAVLRAFQKGKSRSVRSASGSTRAAVTTPVDEVEARPAPASAPQEVVAAKGGPREPDAPVPRRRPTPEVTPHRASAEHVAAGPAGGSSADAEAVPEALEPSAELEADVPGETEATVPGARPPVAPDDQPDVASAVVDHGLPAPPEADLDPLAGIDFDDLPGVDEDDEEDDHTHVDLPSPARVAAGGDVDLEGRITMVPVDGPDSTLPSMQMAEVTLTAGRIDASLSVGDLTERTLNPLLVPAEPTGEVTVTAANPLRGASPETAVSAEVPAPAVVEPTAAQEPAEVEADEIELLDDEDLLMVEEEEEPDEVPEWKQALASAQPDTPAGPAPADEGDVDLGDD